MQPRQLNTTSIYRRLSQVGLSVILLIVLLYMWVDATTLGEQVQKNHASSQTRQMFEQSAQMALRQFKAKNTKEMTILLNDLARDPYVLQAIIYDRTGKLIAKSDNAQSVHDIYIEQRAIANTLPPYNTDKAIKPKLGIKMYVTEMMDGTNLRGYLHVSYLQQKALQEPLQHHQNIMQKTLLMMLLSGLMGFMLTRGFSRFSRQSYRIVDNQD